MESFCSPAHLRAAISMHLISTFSDRGHRNGKRVVHFTSKVETTKKLFGITEVNELEVVSKFCESYLLFFAVWVVKQHHVGTLHAQNGEAVVEKNFGGIVARSADRRNS